jgi:hypothetical protein
MAALTSAGVRAAVLARTRHALILNKWPGLIVQDEFDHSPSLVNSLQELGEQGDQLRWVQASETKKKRHLPKR